LLIGCGTIIAELLAAFSNIRADSVIFSGGLGNSLLRAPSKTFPPAIFCPRRLPALPETPQSLSNLS